MGRDVFLTRLVLGRSSHEPPEQFPDTPNGAENAPGEEAPQYDERGYPVNPRARALGRALRDAQNDILAAVGVVERKRVHIAAGFPLPPPKDPLVMKQVEAEDLSGTLVAIVGTLTRYAGTWWVSALHDRILTYEYPLDLSFSELVTAQYHWAGPTAFFFAGLPAQLISMITNDGDLWASLVVALIDDALLRSSVSRRNRSRISRMKPWIRRIIASIIELVFAPIVLHAGYQRLFLAPSSQLLPHARAFNPWSRASPFQAIVRPEQLNLGNALEWIKAIGTSPVIMIITWRRAMIRIQRLMYEPLEKGILTPDNPDQYTADETSERHRVLGTIPADSRRPNHAWSNWFFACLNWSWRADSSRGAAGHLFGRVLAAAPPVEQSHEAQHHDSDEGPPTPADGPGRPTSPQTPAGAPPHAASTSPHSLSDSHRNHDDERDATVRIASRDEGSGVVSLEIALPEELQNGTSSSRRNASSHENQENEQHQRRHNTVRPHKRTHRVTQLAEEPAEMLGSWVNFTFSDWVLLPLKAVGLRMIALSYLRFLASKNSQVELPLLAHGVYSPWWPTLSGMDLSSGPGLRKLGVFAGRVGLCCALEILFGLGLWGCECAAVTVLGKKYFGWGQAR